MVKIRKFNEEWADGLEFEPNWTSSGYYEIFKNPTRKELNDASIYKAGVRGVVLRNGTFYIGTLADDLIHTDLIKLLVKAKLIKNESGSDWFAKKESFHEFLAVEQKGKSFEFIPAESYFNPIKSKMLLEYKTNFEKYNSNYQLNGRYIKDV